MSNRVHYLLSLAAAVLLPAVAGAKIVVSSQAEFDYIGASIICELEAGVREVEVQINPGTYYFSEDHIAFRGVVFPDASVSISGRDAVIIAAGPDYKPGDLIRGSMNYDVAFLSPEGTLVPAWSRTYTAEEKAELVSRADKLFRIKADFADVPDARDAYIRITHWYTSSVYRIKEIKDGYIYFVAHDLSGGYGGDWNVNDDSNYGGLMPRFRLFNIKAEGVSFRVNGNRAVLSEGLGSVHECSASRFLIVSPGSSLAAIDISGLTFKGNKRNSENGLIEFYLAKLGRAAVHDCRFENIYSEKAVYSRNSDNLTVSDCVFAGCQYSGVSSSHKSTNTVVRGNRFENCGLALTNAPCVSCSGQNYYIADNSFLDFAYSAIDVGYGFRNAKVNGVSGVVEGNSITYSDYYLSSLEENTLMDSGAIYVSTLNDSTVIRYNIISNYSGMKDNRGIFLDDGAYNLQVYGNVITGIANSYCIDSRRVASVEKIIGRANYNNKVYDNVVDGKLRLEGREEDSLSCSIGPNFCLSETGQAPAGMRVTSGVISEGDDVPLRLRRTSGERKVLSYSSFNKLRRAFPDWNKVRKHFRFSIF
ncbi:MAG: right-handed parallel beta-helix repeat-containing protein [Bacteroidales bacterium]|nr:right-handed parallel beta-helix repeat-containing protein [Bacteroidales bacterium]